MKMIKNHLQLFIPLFAIAALAPVASAAMLLEYQFEEGTGTAAANSGTLGAVANGTLLGTATWTSDTPSASGSSLSIPVSRDGARVSTPGALSEFNGLSTITGLMWLKPTTLVNGDRILSSWDGTHGFDWQIQTPISGTIAANNYKFVMTVNGTPYASNADVTVSGWQFVAFTYDGGLNNLKLYVGSIGGVVTQLGTTINTTTGVLATNTTKPLDVGNTDVNTARNPGALFDGVQIYDSILTSGDLETIRAASIPEPSAWVLIAGAGTFIMVMRSRRNGGGQPY
jgi:hypothetical protein